MSLNTLEILGLITMVVFILSIASQIWIRQNYVTMFINVFCAIFFIAPQYWKLVLYHRATLKHGDAEGPGAYLVFLTWLIMAVFVTYNGIKKAIVNETKIKRPLNDNEQAIMRSQERIFPYELPVGDGIKIHPMGGFILILLGLIAAGLPLLPALMSAPTSGGDKLILKLITIFSILLSLFCIGIGTVMLTRKNWNRIALDDDGLTVSGMGRTKISWAKISDVTFDGKKIEFIEPKNQRQLYWIDGKSLESLDPERLYLTIRRILDNKRA